MQGSRGASACLRFLGLVWCCRRLGLSPEPDARQHQQPCKGTRFEKGELRIGTLVTIKEHQSMSYRHWYARLPSVSHPVASLLLTSVLMVHSF